MADYSKITVVAVLDSNGELHKINYEQLANLPSSMKNPNAIIVFGQRYDGSNEVTIVPKIATSSEVGCVKPVAKTDAMTTNVGVDSNGRLYTTGTAIDEVITAFSGNAASSNAVYQYGLMLTDQMQTLVNNTKEEIEDGQDIKHLKIEKEIADMNSVINELKTNGSSQLDAIGKRIDQTNTNVVSNTTEISKIKTTQKTMEAAISENSSNIQFNAQDISNIKPRVTQLETDITEVKSRNIGYFFDTEQDLLDWIKIQSNKEKLGIGVCLYISGNSQIYYVWNGINAIKTTIIADVIGGYMHAQNPIGSGYMRMNNSQVGSNAASFGDDNISAGVYSFTAGLGLNSKGQTATAIGQYNAEPKNDEVFSVGFGANDKNRKTVHYISDSGDNHSCGDITAFDTELNAPITTDKSKVAVSCTITNKQSNVDVKVDWDSFITIITRNDAGVYNFVYKDGHWSSDSYNFAYIAQQETYYYPIDVVDISFVYNDGTEGKPTITFVDNDTITVHAPLQKTISLRELYNTVSELYQYVHKES